MLAVTDVQYKAQCCVSIATLVTKTHHTVTYIFIVYLVFLFNFISSPACMTEGLGCCGKIFGLKRLGKNALSSFMIVLTPDRKEIELKDIGWIHLAQDGDK
jgi:hypothetical protein